jgi:hypothetical protein
MTAEHADIQVRRPRPEREHRLRARQFHRHPAGAVVGPLGVDEVGRGDAEHGRDALSGGLVDWPAAQRRRGQEGQAGRGAPQRDQAGLAFLHDDVAPGGRAARLQPGVGGAEGGVPGERQLLRRGEDPHPVVRPLVGRRQQEGGLRQVGPAGEQPHLIVGEPVRPVHHRHRVANERLFCEYVNLPELPVHAVHPRASARIAVIDARARRRSRRTIMAAAEGHDSSVEACGRYERAWT